MWTSVTAVSNKLPTTVGDILAVQSMNVSYYYNWATVRQTLYCAVWVCLCQMLWLLMLMDFLVPRHHQSVIYLICKIDYISMFSAFLVDLIIIICTKNDWSIIDIFCGWIVIKLCTHFWGLRYKIICFKLCFSNDLRSIGKCDGVGIAQNVCLSLLICFFFVFDLAT